ncbi:MAG TPA: Crp/Fnr family transcriptional regulator [Methylibium sp.]|uniref:Crp/Fnr family transcriptional regulator n=1 Tax=Methylibium sp. TaxID=2067992 RepID=UPI002DB8B9EF|nr:Crp/Fnr family transcriptional regulator [Methylibium sp.]HEU4459866.1 Crp/Fnr family transcriptional regulator [Methylibium sp.]
MTLGLHAALASDAWFAGCDPALRDELLRLAQPRSLAPGGSLFRKGEDAEGLCCVTAGALRIGSLQADGSEQLLGYLEPYQWFGEISLIDGEPRTHTATADGPTTVLLAPQPALLAWLDRHPACWRDVARLACAKLRLSFGVLEDIAVLPLEQRLAKRLWLVATGYGARGEAPVRRLVRLPQEQLALMLGVSRQSANKALRALEKAGVIALHYGAIELLQPEALHSAGGLPAQGATAQSRPCGEGVR